ncbi:MAG: ABC transporter permease [Acidimicrobiales bacterium]|nr:ABC transporter permease [Acidimicrobiales bacterium]
MDQFLQASITGLATAAILAVAASGLVLTYTTTGIFNFAHGAVGMLGAFAYWQLRFEWGWSAPLALVVVLGVLAPLLGVAIERVVMRGLYDAPETSRVVVSIGLLAALLGLGLWVWPPDVARPLVRFWGNESVAVLGVAVTWHDVAAFATAIGLAVGLRLLLYRARPGVAMRAAVDDRSLAMLNGARPHRSAMLAWAIGCTTAAVAGILVAPSVGLSHVNLTLMIVNAYAAAMIGRLRNLPMTFLGAILVGLLDAYALAYLPTDGILLAQFRFAIPVILLFVVLMALPQGRLRGHSTRATREIVPRPPWLGSLATAAGFVVAGVVTAQVVTGPDAVSVQKIVAVAIIGLSLVPLVGFAGQLSLCQMSFAGIGAVLMAHHGHGGDPRGLLVAAVVTGVIGALVALPTVRMAGIYLALATAAFAMLLDQWIFGLRDFEIGSTTIRIFGTGSVTVDPVDVPGVRSEQDMLVFLSIVFALMYLLVVGVRRSTFGQRLLALKDSPAASATLGINTTVVKLVVFSASAAMAGFGGALYGGTLGAVGPQSFAFVQSLPLLLLGVVGGIGTAAGALVAGVLIGGLPLLIDVAPWFENVNRVLPGTMGIALGRNPNGIAHSVREALAPLRRQPVLLAGTAVGVVAVVALRLGDVLTGGPFALALVGEVAAGGLAAQLLEARRRPAGTEIPAGTPIPAGTAVSDEDRDDGPGPLEWAGVDRPFTDDEVATLDRVLGLSPRAAPAPALVAAPGSGGDR